MLSHDKPHVDIGPLRYLLPFVNLLRPLSPNELNGLRENIRARGIEQPVVVHETDDVGVYEVLDGANRVQLGSELGLDKIPIDVRRGLTDDQKRQLAFDLNLHRRHLDRKAHRKLIAARLEADPEQSDRAIAESLGVDHKTVGAVRREKIDGGEIPHHDERVGKDGVKQPTKPKSKSKSTAAVAGGHNRQTELPPISPLENDQESRVTRAIATAPTESPPLPPGAHESWVTNWSDLGYYGAVLSERAKLISRLAKTKASKKDPEHVREHAKRLQQFVWALFGLADHYDPKVESLRQVTPGTTNIARPDSIASVAAAGVGLRKAHEAINQLRGIPVNDPQRQRAWQLVDKFLCDNDPAGASS
jgi:ParB-like chromosome segregation protein Spo0J